MNRLVPVEPIADAIEDAMRFAGAPDWQSGQIVEIAPLSAIIAEIARSSGRNRASVARLVYGIRTRTTCHPRRGGPTVRTAVAFDVADDILCALDREYLWHSDPRLAEAYAPVEVAA